MYIYVRARESGRWWWKCFFVLVFALKNEGGCGR